MAVAGRTLRLHVHRVDGPGRPGVLLHGLLSSGRQWRGLFERLRGERALWAPDLPGCGRSELLRRPQRAEDYADVLERWADAEGLGRITLVGHSFGGMVAVDWAARRPERIAALGLLAPAGVFHPGYVVPRAIANPLLGALLLRLLGWPPVGRRAFRYVVDRLDAVPPREQADFAWAVRHCRMLFGLRTFYAFDDLGARLRAVRCPTWIGWGQADRIVPPADAEVFRAGITGARLTWWPCGHSAVVERPGDVTAFVRTVAAT